MQMFACDDDLLPRVSVQAQDHRPRHRRASSCCGVPISRPKSSPDGLCRRWFSYEKLPQYPLKLSVRKLDGSSFGIEVAKTATVAELKEAVEQAFSHIPRTGLAKISWSHVWGHFCLSYDGWKLVLDSEPISIYGIDNGDQLYFVRHHSTNHNLPKRRSKYRLFALKQPKIPDDTFEREQNDQKDYGSNDQNNSPDQDYDDRNGDIVTLYELKLSQSLGRWFQYQRVGSPASRYQGGSFSSKLANGISGGLRSILWLCSSDKLDSRRDPLEEV